MTVRLPDHLDLIAAAPDGIRKLRGLILELAVRGKLVPQDPNDEPASELLKRIAQERARLKAEGVCKKSKVLPLVEKDKQPFEVPNGWEWVRFESIFSLEYGDNLPAPKRTNSGEYPVYGSNGIVGTHSEYRVTQPCVVVGRKGSAGALNLCLHSGCWVTDVAYYCIPPSGIYLEFCFKLFHTIGLDELGKGIKPGLSRSEVFEIPVAIPPLAEQHRIVAKVHELMALCDQLEAEQTDSANAHARLVDTLLGTLTQSTDNAELSANWQRLAEHFDTLFTTESSLDALKQTILQLAVMGKLVPQDPNDEPASELLKRIAQERARLEAAGARNRSKPVPPMREDEQPLGWESATLPELCVIGGGATPSKTKSAYWGKGFPWVSPKDMKFEYIFDSQDHVTELALSETRLPRIPAGSVLVVVRGMILLHSFPVAITQVAVAINQDMKSLTPVISDLQPFIALTLRGFKRQILALVDRSTHGTCKLQSEKLFSFQFGIPPLAEQHRIVAKVDELLTLCDRLKADLADSRARQARLSATLIESALAAA